MKKKNIINLFIIFLLSLLTLYNNYRIENKLYTYNFTTKVENVGIFSKYEKDASKFLKNMSLDEKIKQLIIARYDSSNKYNNYGGYIFFESHFKNKSKEEIIEMINDIQKNSKIKVLTAVDEEGGVVNRISTNKNLIETPFKSSQELFINNDFNVITNDTIMKSNFLDSFGINLNLAPVVDISTNKSDYIYKRTIGKDASITAEYAKTVILASKGTNVSYTLKHFPGYGNNLDTHTDKSIDERNYEDIMNNSLLPFRLGIDAGAEAVMISHNIVTSIDEYNPASISSEIHKLLTDNLSFTGVIITDDMEMGALKDIDKKYVKALIAGNNLIITSRPEICFDEIKTAYINNEITEKDIDNAVRKIIEWKLYKGLIK